MFIRQSARLQAALRGSQTRGSADSLAPISKRQKRPGVVKTTEIGGGGGGDGGGDGAQAALELVRISFASREDKKMGVGMSNYLRNQFPCLGMQRPVRNEAQKEILSSWNGAYPELHQLVEELWKEPHREYVLFSSLLFFLLS